MIIDPPPWLNMIVAQHVCASSSCTSGPSVLVTVLRCPVFSISRSNHTLPLNQSTQRIEGRVRRITIAQYRFLWATFGEGSAPVYYEFLFLGSRSRYANELIRVFDLGSFERRWKTADLDALRCCNFWICSLSLSIN